MKWERVRYFKPAEFACKCGCGQGPEAMNEQFVLALDAARHDAGFPFWITSGFRCLEHNARVGGKPGSAHTLGLAVDLAVADSVQRMALVRVLLRYFDRMGVGGGFIHVDMNPDKPAGLLWVY